MLLGVDILALLRGKTPFDAFVFVWMKCLPHRALCTAVSSSVMVGCRKVLSVIGVPGERDIKRYRHRGEVSMGLWPAWRAVVTMLAGLTGPTRAHVDRLRRCG